MQWHNDYHILTFDGEVVGRGVGAGDGGGVGSGVG